MMFAYYEFANSTSRPPGVTEQSPTWYEEYWEVAGSIPLSHLLSGKNRRLEVLRRLHLGTRKGIGWNGRAYYDVRRMPADAEAELARLDLAIQKAIVAKRTWLSDNLRTWPLATRDDCTKAYPGRSKAEAKVQLVQERKEA